VSRAGLEAELKFRAESEAPLLALAAAARLGPAHLGPPRSFEELDRYLDTADGRLAAARWACRLRTRDRETLLSLKGPAQHRAGSLLHLRPEIEGPAGAGLEPAEWPPSNARDRLLELAGGEPLRERLALRQQRTERSVDLDEAPIGTLSLDACIVMHEGAARGRLLVVELELHDPAAAGAGSASGEVVGELASALLAVPGLSADRASKLERALTMIAERTSPRAGDGG
jgi:inorganic triphosphatase YgiF